MSLLDRYRFFVGGGGGMADAEALVPLPEDQAHHARNVLRLAGGEEVILFDGQGRWCEGTVEKVSKAVTWVRRQGAMHIDPPPAVRLTVATAIPKGERAEWLIEQASQLNVHTIQWLETDRGVVKARQGSEGKQKLEKWQRLAIESAKQCGRTHLLQVREPVDVRQFISLAKEDPATKNLWLDPRPGGWSVQEFLARNGMAAGGYRALVGPEGGWSPEEWTLLQAAADAGVLQRVRLTETVLRIETACAAIEAIFMSR